jgi:hypothetical protein
MKATPYVFLFMIVFPCSIAIGQMVNPGNPLPVSTSKALLDTCTVTSPAPSGSYCDLLKGCIHSLDLSGKTSCYMVKVEQTAGELLLNPVTCASDDIAYEIGLLSDYQYFNEKRGLFQVNWQIRYNFLVQIKHVKKSESFEVVTKPLVYERRKDNDWMLRSDIKNENNLPDTISIAYNNLIQSIYKYLTTYKTNSL